MLKDRNPSPFLIAALSALLLGNVWTWRNLLQPPPRLTVTFLDVGQGDSIVVQTPGGHTLIVDAGRRMDTDDMGRRVLVPFLRTQGINRVDALLLTHSDEDHIGGAVSVLQRMAVSRLLLSAEIPVSTSLYHHVLETARQKGTALVNLARGQTLNFQDGVTAELLNPPTVGIPSPNNASLVLRMRYGTTSLLLTGDAEEGAERDMTAACPDLHADILKLGHHGSRTSTTEQFLQAVHPQAAIVSVGANNIFGHPNPQVLERLEARHIPLFRTDRDGAIVVVSDGRKVTLHTTRTH